MMATLMLRFLATLITATTFASSLVAEPAATPDNQSSAAREQAQRRAEKAQVEFDAVTLQAMIEPMMSGMKGGPLGSGQAGRYWQAMMAEQIARQIAASGRLKLLKRLPNTAVRRRQSLQPSRIGLKRPELLPATRAAVETWQTDVHRTVDVRAVANEPR